MACGGGTVQLHSGHGSEEWSPGLTKRGAASITELIDLVGTGLSLDEAEWVNQNRQIQLDYTHLRLAVGKRLAGRCSTAYPSRANISRAATSRGSSNPSVKPA
jgi:hypothetical protein